MKKRENRNLKYLRNQLNLNQVDFAKKLSISSNQLSETEREIREVDKKLKQKIWDVYKINEKNLGIPQSEFKEKLPTFLYKRKTQSNKKVKQAPKKTTSKTKATKKQKASTTKKRNLTVKKVAKKPLKTTQSSKKVKEAPKKATSKAKALKSAKKTSVKTLPKSKSSVKKTVKPKSTETQKTNIPQKKKAVIKSPIKKQPINEQKNEVKITTHNSNKINTNEAKLVKPDKDEIQFFYSQEKRDFFVNKKNEKFEISHEKQPS